MHAIDQNRYLRSTHIADLYGDDSKVKLLRRLHKRHHEVCDLKGVVEEHPGCPVLDTPGSPALLGREQGAAFRGDPIDEGLRAAAAPVVVELRERTVEVAVVVELVKPADKLDLRVVPVEIGNVRRAKKAVLIDGMHDRNISLGRYDPRGTLSPKT